MSRLDLAQLRRALAKGDLAAVYYVHGAEAILKDEALAAILGAALEADTQEFNLDLLSAQDLDPGAMEGACATLPMMAARRVVVIRDIEAWKRKSKAKAPAIAYLERPAPETVLVLVQGNDEEPDNELASRAVAVDCSAPTGDRLEAWLDERLAANDVTITPEGREHLLRATGGEPGLLSAEVQKLSGLDRAEPIDAETVGAMVGVRFGETADDWRDAVLRDETSRALALVPRLLETSGVSGVNLVQLLGGALLVLRWARAVFDERGGRGGALATQIRNDLLFKVRPRVGSYDALARISAEVAPAWPAMRLRAATRAALDADIALKNSTISDQAGIVSDLVLALAISATRRAA
ncbi:MAG: DNA polymerase III subunit delta [Gemmatimonadales bacterium]